MTLAMVLWLQGMQRQPILTSHGIKQPSVLPPAARLYEAAVKANSTKDVYSVMGTEQMTQFVTHFNLSSNYNLTTVEAVDKVFK
jgi:hypothetical protein